MMNKALIRLVALAVVPCLVAEPIASTCLPAGRAALAASPRGFHQSQNGTASVFCLQAIPAPALFSPRRTNLTGQKIRRDIGSSVPGHVKYRNLRQRSSLAYFEIVQQSINVLEEMNFQWIEAGKTLTEQSSQLSSAAVTPERGRGKYSARLAWPTAILAGVFAQDTFADMFVDSLPIIFSISMLVLLSGVIGILIELFRARMDVRWLESRSKGIRFTAVVAGILLALWSTNVSGHTLPHDPLYIRNDLLSAELEPVRHLWIRDGFKAETTAGITLATIFAGLGLIDYVTITISMSIFIYTTRALLMRLQINRYPKRLLPHYRVSPLSKESLRDREWSDYHIFGALIAGSSLLGYMLRPFAPNLAAATNAIGILIFMAWVIVGMRLSREIRSGSLFSWVEEKQKNQVEDWLLALHEKARRKEGNTKPLPRITGLELKLVNYVEEFEESILRVVKNPVGAEMHFKKALDQLESVAKNAEAIGRTSPPYGLLIDDKPLFLLNHWFASDMRAALKYAPRVRRLIRPWKIDVQPPTSGSTEGHVNEAIKKAYRRLTYRGVTPRTAGKIIVDALRTMPEPEYLVNIGTAIDILRLAHKPSWRRIIQVLENLRNSNDHSQLPELIQANENVSGFGAIAALLTESPTPAQLLESVKGYFKNSFDEGKRTAGGYFLATPFEEMQEALAHVPLAGKTVVSLGCGDGGELCVAAAYGAAKVIGVEIDQALVQATRKDLANIARQPGWKPVVSRISVRQGDFFDDHTPFSEADILIYTQLSSRQENKLEERLQRDMKPDARVVVITYPLLFMENSGLFFKTLVPENISGLPYFVKVYRRRNDGGPKGGMTPVGTLRNAIEQALAGSVDHLNFLRRSAADLPDPNGAFWTQVDATGYSREIVQELLGPAPVELTSKNTLSSGLIRRVPNTDSWPTYVVADPLFTLLSENDPDTFSLVVPPPESPAALHRTPNGVVIITTIDRAKSHLKKGAGELENLIEQGDAIFLGASALSPAKESISDDPASPYLDRNEDEASILELWRGRFLLALSRWQWHSPEKWEISYDILESLSSPTAKARFQRVPAETLEFLAADPATWLLAVRDRSEVQAVVNEIFPASVAEDLLQFLKETRPTLEESWETRSLATGLPHQIDGSKNFYTDAHASVLEEGQSAMVKLLEGARSDYAHHPEAVAMLEELIALEKLPRESQNTTVRRRIRELFIKLGFTPEMLQELFFGSDDESGGPQGGMTPVGTLRNAIEQALAGSVDHLNFLRRSAADLPDPDGAFWSQVDASGYSREVVMRLLGPVSAYRRFVEIWKKNKPDEMGFAKLANLPVGSPVLAIGSAVSPNPHFALALEGAHILSVTLDRVFVPIEKEMIKYFQNAIDQAGGHYEYRYGVNYMDLALADSSQQMITSFNVLDDPDTENRDEMIIRMLRQLSVGGYLVGSILIRSQYDFWMGRIRSLAETQGIKITPVEIGVPEVTGGKPFSFQVVSKPFEPAKLANWMILGVAVQLMQNYFFTGHSALELAGMGLPVVLAFRSQGSRKAWFRAAA